MIARVKLWLALRKRKATRIQQQAEAKARYWTAQRKAWANDPMRRGAA